MQVETPNGSELADKSEALTGRQGVLSALSYRSFRMYWSGAFVSSIGSWLQIAAVIWFVRSAGSDTLVGFVNMVALVPTHVPLLSLESC